MNTVSTADPAGIVSSFIRSLLTAFVLAEAFSLAGRTVNRLFIRGRPLPGGSPGAGFLCGWFVFGTLALGIGCAGLLSAPLVLAAGAGVAAACAMRSSGGSFSGGIAAALSGTRRLEAGALAAVLAPALLLLNVPEWEIDCYIYHLGAPDQWLNAHRVLTEGVPLSHHFPLPFDAAFTAVLALGAPLAAKWLVFLSLPAAVTAFLDARGRPRAPGSPWLALVLSLSCLTVFQCMVVGKNDLPAAAACVAGVSLFRAGRRAAGSLFLGMAVAGKPVLAPLALVAAACWWPWTRPRAWLPLAAVALVPGLPWWTKSAIALGNPVVPFAAGLFPVLGWDARNWEGFARHQRSLWVAQAWTPGVFAGAAVSWAWREGIVTVLLVPLGLVLSPARRELGVCVAAAAVALFLGHQFRYLLPAAWYAALVIAADDGFWRRPWHRRAAGWAAVLLVAGRWFPGPMADVARVHLSEALMSPERVLARRWPAFSGIRARLGETRPGRILLVGEMTTFGFDATIRYGGGLGETPLMWRFASENRSADGIAKRVRQTGCRLLVYNHVTAKWIQKYARRFRWDEPMIRAYADYAASRTVPEWTTAGFDFSRGGYVILRLEARGARVPGPVRYLPGTEMIHVRGPEVLGSSEYPVVLADMEALCRAHPAVLPFRAELGYACAKSGIWKEAHAALAPVVAAGVADSTSLPAFAEAALHLGHLADAERAWRAALGANPARDPVLRLGIARTCRVEATAAAGRGRAGEAGSAAARGLEALAVPAAGEWGEREKERAVETAYLKGLLADVRTALGDTAGAARLYREALEAAPGLPGSDAWRRELDRTSGAR